MNFSIIVTCYNEAQNIPLLLERFKNALKKEGKIEVILVDNGSNDGTPSLLNELLPRYPFLRSIRLEEYKGPGCGILAGLQIARGKFLGWTYADRQTNPKDVVKAFHVIKENNMNPNIYVKGKRRGRAWLDELFTSGMGLFESFYLKSRLWDINAQPNVFHRDFYLTWDNPPQDFSLDLYALFMAKKQKLDIIRIPVNIPAHFYAQSSSSGSLNTKWTFIKRTIGHSRKLKRQLTHK